MGDLKKPKSLFEITRPLVQANLDLRNPIFSFLNRELFDLRKIHVHTASEKWSAEKNVSRR